MMLHKMAPVLHSTPVGLRSWRCPFEEWQQKGEKPSGWWSVICEGEVPWKKIFCGSLKIRVFSPKRAHSKSVRDGFQFHLWTDPPSQFLLFNSMYRRDTKLDCSTPCSWVLASKDHISQSKEYISQLRLDSSKVKIVCSFLFLIHCFLRAIWLLLPLQLQTLLSITYYVRYSIDGDQTNMIKLGRGSSP